MSVGNKLIKKMTWNDLKKKLEKLSKEELQKEAIFISDSKTQSGVIDVAKKLPAKLYNIFEDDPNELKTRKQLKDDGMDAEEIENCDVEFEKGEFFIEIKMNY